MTPVYCICISLFLFSCSRNRIPEEILPPAKMEKLMWEQMRADAFIKEFIAKDSSKDINHENSVLQQKIFSKYKTTRQEFYKSYEYYLQHDNMMKDLLDSVIAKEVRANEKEKELKLKKNEQNVP